MNQYSGVTIVKAEYVSVWLTIRRFAEIFNLYYSILHGYNNVVIPILHTVDLHLSTLDEPDQLMFGYLK